MYISDSGPMHRKLTSNECSEIHRTNHKFTQRQSNIDEDWPSPSDIPLPSCFTSLLSHPEHGLHYSSSETLTSSESPTRSPTTLSILMVTPKEIERAIDEYLWHNTHSNSSVEHVNETKMYKGKNNESDIPHQQESDDEEHSAAGKSAIGTNKNATGQEREDRKVIIKGNVARCEMYANDDKYRGEINQNIKRIAKGKRFTSPYAAANENNQNTNVMKDMKGSSNRHLHHLMEHKEQRESNPVKWNSSCKVDPHNDNKNNYNSNNNINKYRDKQESVQATVSRANRSPSTRATSSTTPSWSSVERQSSELLSTAQHYVQEIEQMYHALKRTFDEVESKHQQFTEKNTMNMKENGKQSMPDTKTKGIATKEKTEQTKRVMSKEEATVVKGTSSNSNSNKLSSSDVKRKQPIMTKAKREAAKELQEHLIKLQTQWNRLQMLNMQRQSSKHNSNDDRKNKDMEPLLNPDSVHALIQARRDALQV